MKLADFGEGGDVFVALVDLARGEAQNGAVEVDVVAAAEFGVESGPSSSRAETRPWTSTRARGGVQDARHHLQQRTFAGAVLADNAEGFAALDLEADVVERPEILVALQTVQRQQFLEAVARRVIDRVAFRNTLEFNGVHGWEIERLVYRGRGMRAEDRRRKKEKGGRRPLGRIACESDGLAVQ